MNRDNQIYIEVRLSGKTFRMTFGIPDAQGHIPQTDWRPEWMREKVSNGMKSIFGKIAEV
jgi:hypothetical protein